MQPKVLATFTAEKPVFSSAKKMGPSFPGPILILAVRLRTFPDSQQLLSYCFGFGFRSWCHC